MRREVSAVRVLRVILLAVTALLVGYLAALAYDPDIRDGLPDVLRWFGGPARFPTIAIVLALVASVCLLRYRRARPSTGAPIAIVTGLVATSLLLGIASYWNCRDADSTWFFTPLAWAASLLQGGEIEQNLALDDPCPDRLPVALELAKLLAIGAFAVGVVGVVIGLFRAQSDRLRVRFFTRSVTAVVGIDDDGVSMVAAVARTLVRGSRLVLVTASVDRPCVHEVRNFGAAVLEVDDTRPEILASLRLWRKLDRLYLLSPDPASNLLRLGTISRRRSEIGNTRRLPLIVRIDDPWQAEAWRAQQFGGSDSQWAADAVGKYEVTARRLLDRITGQRVQRVIVCGTSQLTLALCADMAQRRLERSYYSDPSQMDLPNLTLVGEKADEYREDHQLRQDQLGVPAEQPAIDVVAEPPTVRALTRVISEDPGTDAVILVDADPAGLDPTAGTRLAARFPAVPIYAWDPNAQVTDERPPIVGQLHTFRLAMDLPAGQAQDAWERAAMLIHERYASDVGPTSDSTQPWARLDEFYRGSNRRQVANALWMVERIGGHTWNTFGSKAPSTPVPDMPGWDPFQQLEQKGFDRETVLATARTEHELWCHHLRERGWKEVPTHDAERKIHDKLRDWDQVAADDEQVEIVVTRLASLEHLRLMGFDRDAAMAKARAEHELWCDHLRERGWNDGPKHDAKRKIHDKLLDWDHVAADPQLLNATLTRVTILEQLRLMGFDRGAAMGMARAEHEDWCRYLRKWGWTYGPVRDNERKIHDKLLDWDYVQANPELLNTALTSLATTLRKLRELGYRSRPVWERYRRAGTVTAEQRASAWTWTSDRGETMQANVGDWAVEDGSGKSWSVRDDIFRSTYQQIEGNRWRRTGFVHARRADDGETIETLEGPITTKEGYWVLRGAADDQWAMPAEEFAKRYEGPCHEGEAPVPEGETPKAVITPRHGAAPEP